MKLSKEEIKQIANNVKLSLDDQEVEEIQNAISELTNSLEALLEIPTEEKYKIMGNEELTNVFSSNYNESDDPQALLDKVNNYDGEFISVNVQGGSDES